MAKEMPPLSGRSSRTPFVHPAPLWRHRRPRARAHQRVHRQSLVFLRRPSAPRTSFGVHDPPITPPPGGRRMSATSLFRDYLPVPSPASRSSPSSRPVSSIASHRILRARALARSPPRTSPPSVVHRAPASSVAPSRSRRRARSRRLCSPIERPRSSLESRRARAPRSSLCFSTRSPSPGAPSSSSSSSSRSFQSNRSKK